MPDNASISISLLEETDIPGITEFYNAVHHRGRTVDRFRWEFLNNPRMPAIYVVAKDIVNGRIVGTQSAIPIHLIDSENKVTLTAKSEDTLVDKNYRGMDIFNRMYDLLFAECRKKGIRIIWGFTTAQKPFSKLGFSMPYAISQCTMVFDPVVSFHYLNEKNPGKGLWPATKNLALCVLSKAKSYLRHLQRHYHDFELAVLKPETPFNNEELAQHILSKHKNSFIIQQDIAYLGWRINNNPYHREFFGIALSKGGQPVANILFNHHLDGVWYLIQDIYAPDLSIGEKKWILNEAVKKLRSLNRVTLIRTWDFMHHQVNLDYIEVKKRMGFVHVKKGSLFVWKELIAGSGLSPENFILSRIASEGTI